MVAKEAVSVYSNVVIYWTNSSRPGGSAASGWRAIGGIVVAPLGFPVPNGGLTILAHDRARPFAGFDVSGHLLQRVQDPGGEAGSLEFGAFAVDVDGEPLFRFGHWMCLSLLAGSSLPRQVAGKARLCREFGLLHMRERVFDARGRERTGGEA
jgi:hypothetical protein